MALTNGPAWQIYQVTFGKPIQNELVLAFDLLALNPRSSADIDTLGLLAKEGWQKVRLGEYYSQRQALSRFVLGALLLSNPVLNVVRRELRRLSPDVRITSEGIEAALRQEVLKRDVLEGEKADVARRQVSRAAKRTRRSTRDEEVGAPSNSTSN